MANADRGSPSQSRAEARREAVRAHHSRPDGLTRYSIVGEIGVGGMARVHLAHLDGPGGFRKWVAIKRIHRHLAGDDTFVRMFLDEARVAARISHPHVAQVFELGRHRHTYWLAMEYLHGEPLHELICANAERGRRSLDPYLAARLVADAAEGLHAAHELRDHDGSLLNLVHRDVSPHNIFVTFDGAAKMVDFGIATGAGRLACTRAGTLKGKLAYMSPEQIRGRSLDRRADVFALGIVLWELTTGERLFRGETELETLERVQACRVPRPTELLPGYPPQLETILQAALQKDRDRRLPSARELSRALRRFGARADIPVGCEEVSEHVRQVLAHHLRAREALLRSAPTPATEAPKRTARGVRRAPSSSPAEQRPCPAPGSPPPPARPRALAEPSSTAGSASWLVPVRAPGHAAPLGHSATVRAGDALNATAVPRRLPPGRFSSPLPHVRRGMDAPSTEFGPGSDDDDAVTRILRRCDPSQLPPRGAAPDSDTRESREPPPRLPPSTGMLPPRLPVDRGGRPRCRERTKVRRSPRPQPSRRARWSSYPRVPLRVLAAATTAFAVVWIVLLAV